jgi:threonine dehydrogenase-like Zn-dependent dehydrogenase
MALKLAKVLGAQRAIGVDLIKYRLEVAERVSGATIVDASKDDPVEAIRALTGGRAGGARSPVIPRPTTMTPICAHTLPSHRTRTRPIDRMPLDLCSEDTSCRDGRW